MPARRSAPAQAAFTLIELLAVLLIMGLIAGITLPNLSIRTERIVFDAAEELAADLSFVRQRAVATGTPHRIVVDLDAAGWWLEALPEETSTFAAPAAAPGAERSREIPMSAPPRPPSDFLPLGGAFGRPRALHPDVHFESLETLAGGALLGGQAALVFEAEGTAEPALFVLANEDGDRVLLELPRLSDEIRIQRAE